MTTWLARLPRELERSYVATLSTVASYVTDDSTLTLHTATGPVARYRAQ